MTTNDLVRPADQFPLGELCGPGSGTAQTVMPFGLRYAAAPGPGAEVALDWSAIHYDPERQIAVVAEGDAVLPVMKHTSGSTSTSTASQDRTGADTDSDTTQD